MDVHPPLAKMLIALTGWIAGFDGKFDFKEIGKDYLEPGVPYVAMRMFPAVCGVLLAPCMFLTLKAVGCRTMTATLGAGLIIFGAIPPSPRACPRRDPNAPPRGRLLTSSRYRERSSDPGPPDPPRFTSGCRHCFHNSCLFLLHQPA